MAGIAVALGLNALSFSNVPILNSLAGIACGVMDCASGSIMCGGLCIFASVLPYGRGLRKGVVQVVRCGAKTRAILRAAKVTARITRGTNKILGGWSAATGSAEFAKQTLSAGTSANSLWALRKGAHSVRVAHQAREAYHGYGMAFCAANGIGCNKVYLLG
mmetsp:Transcript_24845/g.54487  ORF Transcript_24845/g.54487 Transcript_24845/m.54487 type:complete len:161 (+) Transcript_24845:104-586(+)